MTQPPTDARRTNRMLVGLITGLSLVAPGVAVSALLEHVGADPVARYGAQFLTTVAMIVLLAWFQHRSRARGRPLRR
jgi:hypothetical protein